jgi:small subunit ribosomal protein S16
MSVKIRLARRGRTKKPFYHIVVADSRSPRDGRFIEKIGSYNPLTQPATIEVDREKAFEWLQNGAQPSDTVRSILRFKGVMYRMHLQKGVRKGVLTQEQADAKYNEFIAEKDAKIAKRFEAVRKAKDEQMRKIAGTDMPIKIAEVEVPDSKEEEE